MFTSPLPPLWYPQSAWAPREACCDPSWHMSANISSGAQLCHPRWCCAARSVVGYITPSPAPRGGGKDYANWFWPSKITGRNRLHPMQQRDRSVRWKPRCCSAHKPLQCLHKVAEAFARVPVVRWCGTRVAWAAHLELFPINTGASSHPQHWRTSQPGCGVIKTCAWTPLHRCCFSALQEPP